MGNLFSNDTVRVATAIFNEDFRHIKRRPAITEYGPIKRCQEFKCNGLAVRIVTGCITKATTDCIVHPTNKSVDFNGQVGQSILRHNKTSRRCLKVAIGDGCVVAHSDRLQGLQCNTIIHVDVHSSKELGWSGIVLACIQKADILNKTSITLPLMGTGDFNGTQGDIIGAIVEAIRDYLKQGKMRLTQIDIVANTQSDRNILIREFKDFCQLRTADPCESSTPRLDRTTGIRRKPDTCIRRKQSTAPVYHQSTKFCDMVEQKSRGITPKIIK